MIIIYIMMIMLGICFFGGMLLPVIQVLISNEETEATIIKINTKNFSIPGHDNKTRELKIHFPVFEYYIDGERYQKESYSGYENMEFEIGEKIKVKYPKNKPEDAFIAKDAKGKIVTGLGIIIVVCIVIAIVSMEN